LLENEGQVRVRLKDGNIVLRGGAGLGKVGGDGAVAVTPAGIEEKLNRLNHQYEPRRIWLYSFSQSDYSVHGWFRERGWRHAFQSIGGLFSLDLYVKN
jgi:hypothetical protein